MLSIAENRIEEFFAAVSRNAHLYIPVADESKGLSDFKEWQEGMHLSHALKTVRSAKDFFFPKVEPLVNYRRNGLEVTVEDPRKEPDDFVVFGVRACDAASFEIIDAVYLNMTPMDSYYKMRREHGTIITFACTEPRRTCFCPAYKIDATEPGGDISCWLADGTYYFKANTPKGESLIESVRGMLSEKDDSEVLKQKEDTKEKLNTLPFAHLNLSKFYPCDNGNAMMKIFNSPVWDRTYLACLGCGTCTYVCPTCMCFDVRDFDTGDKIQQFRCWDSCMYSDFTQMAAANPRTTQKERFRQRFMHKLVYYPMEHGGRFQCVGCGRCLESCPVHLNIVKVIKTYNEISAQGGE